MKKNYLIIALTAMLLASCGGNSNEEINLKNGLKNKFSNDVEYNDVLHRKDIVEHGRYLYTSSYPLNTIHGYGCYEDGAADSGQYFKYSYTQTLMLEKDYTYHYKFNVGFGNLWNDPNFIGVNADIYGTYTFAKLNDTDYEVKLSTPKSGVEEYHGCDFDVSELFWFGGGKCIGSKHSTPDKLIDFALNIETGFEEYDFFTSSKTIKVSADAENPQNNKVYDELFYPYYLDLLGQYCSY